MPARAAVALLVVLLVGGCAAEPVRRAPATRSSAVLAEFQRQHPCPATSSARGACPGYIRDHIVPLCAGGPDHPDNLQWQTVAAAKAKDREEMRECRRLRAGG